MLAENMLFVSALNEERLVNSSTHKWVESIPYSIHNRFVGYMKESLGMDACKIVCVFSLNASDVGKEFVLDEKAGCWLKSSCFQLPPGTAIKYTNHTNGEVENLIVTCSNSHFNSEAIEVDNRRKIVNDYRYVEIVQLPDYFTRSKVIDRAVTYKLGDIVHYTNEAGISGFARVNGFSPDEKKLLLHCYNSHARSDRPTYMAVQEWIWGATSYSNREAVKVENCVLLSDRPDCHCAFKVGDLVKCKWQRFLSGSINYCHLHDKLCRVTEIVGINRLHMELVDDPDVGVFAGEAEDYYLVKHADEPNNEARICCSDCGKELPEEAIDRPVDPDKWPTLNEYYENDWRGYHVVSGDDRAICTRCFENNYSTCYHCGSVCEVDDMTYIDSIGEYVCLDCRDERYTYCDRCEEYMDSDDIQHVFPSSCSYGEYWCSSCCETAENNDEIVYCPDCNYYIGADLDECPNCGVSRERYNDNAHHCREDRGDYLHNYTYKPMPRFFGMAYEDQSPEGAPTGDDDVFYYGVEAETTANGTSNGDQNEMARLVARIENNPMYGKYDGSIDPGCECVTHPCTRSYHLHSPMWDEYEKAGKEAGMIAHNSSCCGIHIHISRKPFEEAEIEDYEEQIMYVINHFRDDWMKIARRGSSTYASYLSVIPSSVEEAKKYKKTRYHEDRYEAVNLINAHTVEIRIFKGTLKASTIRATIWLVDHMCNFIVQGKDVENSTFLEIVGLTDDNCPEFVKDYARKRGVLLQESTSQETTNTDEE